MRQFVWVTGARPQETIRLSRHCNALSGQSGHILKNGQSALTCFVKSPNRAIATISRLFPGLFSALTRHGPLFMSS